MVQEIRFSLLCLMDCIHVRMRDKESLHRPQKRVKTTLKTQNHRLHTPIIQRIPKIAILIETENKGPAIERDKKHVPERPNAKR